MLMSKADAPIIKQRQHSKPYAFCRPKREHNKNCRRQQPITVPLDVNIRISIFDINSKQHVNKMELASSERCAQQKHSLSEKATS